MDTPRYNNKKNITLLVALIITLVVIILIVHKQKPLPVVTTEAVSENTEPSATTQVIASASKTTLGSHAALTSDNIIWFTNYYREQYDLKPLTLSIKLRDSAYHKSLDMFKYQYFAHYRPSNGLGFDNFIDNQKYEFVKIGENLAMGDFTTSKEIVDAWMASSAHRRNLLDPSYTEIGVSVDYGIMSNKDSALITQHLGRPVTTCPTINEKLQKTIKTLTGELIELRDIIDMNEGDVLASINQYNTILSERAQLVSEYNKQIDAFDNCVTRGAE